MSDKQHFNSSDDYNKSRYNKLRYKEDTLNPQKPRIEDITSTENEVDPSTLYITSSGRGRKSIKESRKRKHSSSTEKTNGAENMYIQSSSGKRLFDDEGNPTANHRNRRKTKKKMKVWKKVVISVASVLLSLILIFTGTYAYLFFKGSKEMLPNDYQITVPQSLNNDIKNESKGEYITYKGKKYQYNTNITNILCLGIDKREIDSSAENGMSGQADVIILVALDTSTGKITMVNVSRELMASVKVYSAEGNYIGTRTEQICLSYAYGNSNEKSCENTLKSVQQVFYNLPIMSYFALDLDGISAVNDSIGGVDVVSPETIAEFEKGKSYHLEGQSAEDFIRKRRFDIVDANNYRNKRQRLYINSFIKKFKNEISKDFSTFMNLYNAASDYSYTNINLSKASYLAGVIMMNESSKMNFLNIPGKVEEGERYAEFYMDEEKFYEMFLEVFYKPVN